jgi:hypothetical protein
MTKASRWSTPRRHKNRCTSMLYEQRIKEKIQTGKMYSWRCQLVVDHDGPHSTIYGHRRWSGKQWTRRLKRSEGWAYTFDLPCLLGGKFD